MSRTGAGLALAALVLVACDEGDAAPKTPVRLSADEAAAALAAREVREDAREGATPRPEGRAGEPASPAEAPQESVTIGARLLDAEARPLAGAQLARIVSQPLVTPRETARADAGGVVWLAVPRAELAGVEVLELVAEASGTMRHLVRLPRARFEGETHVGLGEILLQPGGSVRGRVLDEWGAPFANAFVGLGPELAELGGDLQEMRALASLFPMLEDLGRGNAPPIALTDGEGRFVLEGVPLGRCMAVAAALPLDGRVLVPDRAEGVLVQAGEPPALRDLVLRTARAEELVQGVVQAPDGSPVAGAFVHLELGGRTFAGGRTVSGSDGRFAVLAPTGFAFDVVPGDPEGRYRGGTLPGVRAGEPNAIVRFSETAAR